jgi:carbohydrate kinase (thermoresistant glucokinase family)
MTCVVVMGVSGSGKSTIAALLAERLGVEYVDGDWLHPKSNVEKMQRGIPLEDEDRWPWLRAIALRVAELRTQGRGCVVACSALKRAYRDVLRDGHDDVRFVHLAGPAEAIAPRLSGRDGHFMPAALLASQFAALEPPQPDERAIVASVEDPPARIVEAVVTSL